MSTNLPSSFDGDVDFYEESRLAKLRRRIVEEPLIPAGCLLTAYFIFKATRSIRSGNKERTNMMFRRRIYAQFFTVGAMVGGSYYYQGPREHRKNQEAGVAERKAREKNALWIKELEIRDQEDKEIAEQARIAKQRRAERDAAGR